MIKHISYLEEKSNQEMNATVDLQCEQEEIKTGMFQIVLNDYLSLEECQDKTSKLQARIDALEKQCKADAAEIKQRDKILDVLLRKHKDLQ